MPTLQKFFANITSHRDNGASIELNLRGLHYSDPGNRFGPPEQCREPESETTVTQCEVITEVPTPRRYQCLSVDFYEFSKTEQERFIEAALACMEPDE